MSFPEQYQGVVRTVGQGGKSTPVALALTHMYALMVTIDIGDSQVQYFANAHTGGKCQENGNLVTQFPSTVDHGQHFGAGKDIRKSILARRFDEFDPVPILVVNMVVKELQAIAINLDGRPGALRDQPVEVFAQLLEAEVVRRLLKIRGDPANGMRVGLNGGLAFTLAAKSGKVPNNSESKLRC